MKVIQLLRDTEIDGKLRRQGEVVVVADDYAVGRDARVIKENFEPSADELRRLRRVRGRNK